MFEPEIDNDLKFVDDTIRSYYGLNKIGTAPKQKEKKEPDAVVEKVDKLPG